MNKKKEKKPFQFPSSYTVLLGIIILIAIVTQFVPQLIPASVNDVINSPINGMIGVKDLEIDSVVKTAIDTEGIPKALEVLRSASADGQYIGVWNQGSLAGSIDVAFFILLIGGFLGVVTKTGALDAGVSTIVKKLKGKEIYLIPILMIIFSLGGTSYGMAEESLAFYALIITTMLAAGFDPLVAVGTLVLGCGTGVLGSTVNPFAIGAAISASKSAGIEVNQVSIIIVGILLWAVTLSIAIYAVMCYAKKVKANQSNTLLSKEEFEAARSIFSNSTNEEFELTGRRKLVLALFGISFVVMILGVVPWEDFGITWFSENTGLLLGAPLGTWYFPEFAAWFLFMGIVIGLVYGLKESDLISSFISGCSEMVGVAMILAVARGVSFMMTNTGLDLYILDKASGVLNEVSGIAFVNIAFVIFIGLSFLIPSTSGLASVAMPIFAPLTANLNLAPEVIISVFSAGSGIVNLITPTSGVVMGGLAIAKIEYSTWLKFVWKILLVMFVAICVVLSGAIMLL